MGALTTFSTRWGRRTVTLRRAAAEVRAADRSPGVWGPAVQVEEDLAAGGQVLDQALEPGLRVVEVVEHAEAGDEVEGGRGERGVPEVGPDHLDRGEPGQVAGGGLHRR